MEALSLARINSQLSLNKLSRGILLSRFPVCSSKLFCSPRPEDILQPRHIIDVHVSGKERMSVIMHCGGQPNRYDTATVIVLHVKRNTAVSSSLENQLLDGISAWPSSEINDAILTVVNDFIARVPHFYKDSATRITMWTASSGSVEYNFEEEQEALPDYPDVPSSFKGIRNVRIADLSRVASMGRRIDLVTWRGDHFAFTQIRQNVDRVLRNVDILSRRISERIISLPAVVVDSNGCLRGYLTPHIPNGNLMMVFEKPTPSSNQSSSASFELGTNPNFYTKLRWSTQIAQAVADLHRAGITVGNLSPSSILVKSSGDIVICDLSGPSPSESMGGWRAPENASFANGVATGDMQTSTDVYHLGGVLWMLASGPRKDFVWTSIPRSPAKRLAASGGTHDIPDWYKTVYEACLATDPSRRPKVSQVIEALADNGKGFV